MKVNFFNLSAEEQLALIRKAGDEFDMPDTIIEKDIWICWLLDKIFSLPVKMSFKGGTSLSKVFGLIKRFSEDCDVTIDYRNFKEELNLTAMSRTQLKKTSDNLKEQLRIYVVSTILPFLRQELLRYFPDKKFEIILNENGEQLHFYYPSVVAISQGYLRNHVLIEFGMRNNIEPCDKQIIKSYVEQAVSDQFGLPQPVINTLSPLRTFWEKATLIHVECHRDRMTKTPERFSRHWYDLCMLKNSWVGEKVLVSDIKLLKNVIEHKKAFFNSSYANYDDCLVGKFRLIPGGGYLKDLQEDFKKMINSGMFHETPKNFSNIVDELRQLERLINELVIDNVN